MEKKPKETGFNLCMIACAVFSVLACYFTITSIAYHRDLSYVSTLCMGGCMASIALGIKTMSQKENKKLQRCFGSFVALAVTSLLLTACNAFASGLAGKILGWVIVLGGFGGAVLLYVRDRGKPKE